MTPEFAGAARKLLSLEGAPGATAASSAEIAARAVKSWEKLSEHFAKLIGDTGVRTLLNRCVSIASAKFPCLATARASSTSTESPWSGLHDCLARQDPEYAIEAFTGLFATFVELLGRFIGEALVAHILHEIWPRIFPMSIKESQ